ncbi:two-component sensor histidine kinase [Bacillus sp. V5-8f]|nr:two-component sensor histidine kinase [Bacillus sp. V5-8f]
MLYSGLIMLFLIIFIFVVYFLLYSVILHDQERELETMATEEGEIVEDYLTRNSKGGLYGFQGQEVVLSGVDQFFYYVVNANGELVMGDEAISELRPELFGLVHGWSPDRNKFRQETLSAHFSEWGPRDKGKRDDFRPREEHHELRLLMTGRPIFFKGEPVGMLYVGKDISFAYQLFNWLLIILIGLAVVFFGVAFFLSRVMSKKAMVPISKAFTRQQEFVADASHELRTPLSVMLSSINAMEMTVDTQKDEFSGKVLSNMKDEVKRMTGLVGDLLTLARSDSGTVELRRETFDLRPIAEKAIESVGPLAKAKGIKLGFHGPDTLITNGDSERLTYLFYIMLDNGIKYTPNEGEVQLFIAAEGKELVIQAKDSGIGIKPEEQARIFDRFYRSDKVRSRQMGSHGLGLAIAKWIVEIHGGTIRVDSELGKGSTFTVRIPNHLEK